MAAAKPRTPEEYIRAAPAAGQAHLRKMQAVLQAVAPKATEVIKWGNPFFVEPRFLFAYSAHKEHLNLAPSAPTLQHFAAELEGFRTTKYMLQLRYDEPFPEALVRKIAKYQLGVVSKRKDDAFW